ncbi:MAG TPA: DapH/DapD/GlmU-related protein [Polyangiaceae bacterium]
MSQLDRIARVASEELDFDSRRVAAGFVSRVLPQNAFNRLRTALLRALGVRIGKASLVGGALRLTGSGSLRDLLTIGPGCYLTGRLHVDLSAPVTIGARVYMGYDVELLTVNHAIGGPAQRCGERVYAPIEIGDGVWIASRAVILPGVRVGPGAVVAAGAVVSRDVPPNVLVGGVPARPMRRLPGGSAAEAQDLLLAGTWQPAPGRA